LNKWQVKDTYIFHGDNAGFAINFKPVTQDYKNDITEFVISVFDISV